MTQPEQIGEPLSALVAFIADWAHDCSPSNAATPWDRQHSDEIDPRSYGFDDIEDRCRTALAAIPATPDVGHEGPTPRDCPECLRLHDA